MSVAALSTTTTARSAPTAAGSSSATGAPTTRAWPLGIRYLNGDAATVQFPTIELGDRVLRILGGRHLDEPEATGLT